MSLCKNSEVTPSAASIQNDTWATLEYVDQGSGECVVVTADSSNKTPASGTVKKACYLSWGADSTIWKKPDETDYETETECEAANVKWKFNGQTDPTELPEKSVERVCNADPTCFGVWRDDVAQVWKAYCSEQGTLCTTAGDANANSLIGGLHGHGDLEKMRTDANNANYSPTRFYSCMTKL